MPINSKHFFRAGLSTLALLGLSAGLLAAAPVPAERFATSSTMKEETRSLLNYLEYSHYLRLKLSDIDSGEIISEYLQSFDPRHLYFTQREVDEAKQRHGKDLEQKLAKGQLDAAFTLFLDFRQRAMERNQWILSRLEQPFDFDADKTYEPDRSKSPWPLSGAELNQLWERQLQYELLNEMLSSLVPEKDDEGEEGAEADSSPAATATTATTATGAAATGDEAKPADAAKPQTATGATATPPTREEALKDAIATVKKRYQRQSQWVQETEPEDVQEIFLSTLARLYDPHSTFMSANTMEEFSMAIRNSLVGIGAVLSDVDGYCTIKELLPGGPADLSGRLKAEDQILGVAQGKNGEMVDVIGMRLQKIVKMIRGAKGTEVRLLVRPANADPSERVTITLLRDEIKLTEQLAQAQLYTLPAAEGKEELKIGVINLPAFYGSSQPGSPANNTTSDVAELIEKLKADGMQALVLDLRSNGGGLLGEAISLTGLFLPVGPVVQVRNSRGQVQSYMDETPGFVWGGPLAVLVSRFSASASEITAGALRDNQRALIIGDETTHGKGTVQAIFDMNRQNFFSMMRSSNRGAAKITVQKYYLPGGDSTQIDGVRSDIALPSFNAYLPIGEGDLPGAMIHDAIEPVQWDYNQFIDEKIAGVSPELISALRESSEQRQSTLPEFGYLNRNIEFLRKKQEEKKLSLNLSSRLSQRQDDRAFREKMDADFDKLRKDGYPFEKVLLDAALKQQSEQAARKSARSVADGATATTTAAATAAAAKGETTETAFDNTALATQPLSTTEATGSNPDAGQGQADAIKADTDAASLAVAEEEEKLPRVDIHLRETLRVMSDWIDLLQNKPDASAQVAADTSAKAGAAAQAAQQSQPAPETSAR